MELKDIIKFIRKADRDTLSIIRAEAKNVVQRTSIRDLCAEDIRNILAVFPNTRAEYKGYRYDVTAVTYARYIQALTDAITHNYICRHNSRGYPCWSSIDSVPPSKEEDYKAVYHAIASTVLSLMDTYGTTYNTPDQAPDQPD